MNDITNINSNRASLSSNQSSSIKSQNEAKQSNQSSDSTVAGDRVTLTSTASRLKDLEHQLITSSSVDSARVSAMQTAISNGDYNVDADRIADKMLAFEDFISE